jgi:hypothetical protein
VTKRVSTFKLPDGQYTQTTRETLKELFRVHLPDSSLINESGNELSAYHLSLLR